jgi:hypothetical protein
MGKCKRWRSVSFRLSPGDHWERNGILDQMLLWGKSKDPVFFCVGPFGSKHSWVTSFSLDLITILQSVKVTLTFALCDRPRDFKNPDLSTWSPTMLVKRLLGHLLEQEPMLFLRHPEIFTVRNFEKAKDFPAVWRLLERVVERLDNRLFIIIDRIDACKGVDDRKVSLGGDLLRSLVTLARKHQQKLQIVITSAEKPPLELCETLKLRYAYINTQKTPRRREWQHDDDLDSEDDLQEGAMILRELTKILRFEAKTSRKMELVKAKKIALLKAAKVARPHMEKARLDAEKLAETEMIARSKVEEKAEEREELEGER